MKKEYKDFLFKAKETSTYWSNLFTLELTEDISKIMEDGGISQKKLSRLLGTSEAYISKVLNGNENLSIKSISKLAFALDCAPHIHIAPKDIIVEWKERGSTETRISAKLQFASKITSGFNADSKITKIETFRKTKDIPGVILDELEFDYSQQAFQ